MKTQIEIILEEDASNKQKGNCFETLIRNLLSIHQYKIRSNLRFTGMELDLLAEHKQRNNEILYVECKAKEKVSSTELRNFWANVFHHKANFGYFFRTKELEYDAGGLLQEYRQDDRYKNLTFFEPENIIDMLTSAKMIFEPISELANYIISKKILAVTYLGDYLIYLINKSNIFPTQFIVVNANSNTTLVGNNVIELLKIKIDELSNLTLIPNFINAQDISEIKTLESTLETISEVQESEKWYDYLPASSTNKHFVGRDVLRTQILEYFKEVQTNKSSKRIFYLNGKSGWGKSSLLLELKGRCRNRHYKNKFFAIAIDTRSAISDNFVALAFEKLISSAIDQNFVSNTIFDGAIRFTSNVDLLTSEYVQNLNRRLVEANKFLVLIFDQFEDVFRKKDLFKSFYKFLSDVTDKKPNIIVGFSWKSEFFIPNDEPAYHYWQQAKEQAREFIIGEFGEKEIDGIIKQLEQSVGKLDREVKNRIKESSQGLPWLTKKLCIHIYEQIQSGVKKDKLIEYNLNIKDLFEKDKERVDPEELKALKLIAQRAYDGVFFEISEVGETVDSTTIDALLHKRLIIKSGANYNIYWDIFRDYLVTNAVPTIGESYLLRQSVNVCLEVFLLFNNSTDRETIESLLNKHRKNIGYTTLENILIELRNFGLVQKNDEYYSIAKDSIEVSNEGFINYITQKFQNYTPYLVLNKLGLARITKDDIIKVLKSIFKQQFQEKTWEVYSLNLIGYFLYSHLKLKDKIVEPRKGRGEKTKHLLANNNVVPRSTVKELVVLLNSINTNGLSIKNRYYRDLLLFKIMDENRRLTEFGKALVNMTDEQKKNELKAKAQQLPKMVELKKVITDKKVTGKSLINIVPDDFFEGKQKSSKIIYATVALGWLK